jgi:hypothetical protein
MTTAAPIATPPPEPRPLSPLAAFLSYLVPGLGQIVQGRIAKGLLFFVCLYGLFFAGMAMCGWEHFGQNVYIAKTAKDGTDNPPWENNSWHLPRPVANLWNRLHYAGQFWIGVAAWPALWHYNAADGNGGDSFWQKFERAPSADEEDEINRQYGKLVDIAWVYTVVAGVLNILVIYDALAGPAFASGAEAVSSAGDRSRAAHRSLSQEGAV